MKDAIIDFLENLFGNSQALIIFIGSAIPITEQRATIPLGIYWDMPPLQVFLLAFFGSLLPVPLLLLFFRHLLLWLHKIRWLDFFTRFVDNKIHKAVRKFEKSSELALIIFVAIPLPGTGLWTGSAVASVMGFNLRKAFICVILGGLLSATVLTLVSSLIRAGILNFL